MKTWMMILPLIFAANLFAADDDAKGKQYEAKRAAEKAAAELAVKELTVREQETLSPDDFIRLSMAYNELGDNRLALEAVCKVKDEVLAAKKQLDNKAVCFQNMSRGEDKMIRIRELAFIDRCLDRRWGNQGVWLWRKSKVVCQSSVTLEIPTRGDQIGSPAHIVDREQFEYSFELLKQAFEAEPNLYNLAGVGHDFMWVSDFPLLNQESRFKELMKAPKTEK